MRVVRVTKGAWAAAGDPKDRPRVLGAWLYPRGRRARLGAAPWGLETREKTRAGAARPPSCGDERESPPGPPAPGSRAGSRAVLEMAGGRGAPRWFGPCRALREGHRLPGPSTPAPPLSFPQTRPPVSGSLRGGPGWQAPPGTRAPGPAPFRCLRPLFPRGARRGRQGGCAEAAPGPERQPQALPPRERAPAVGEVCSGSLKLGSKSPLLSWVTYCNDLPRFGLRFYRDAGEMNAPRIAGSC